MYSRSGAIREWTECELWAWLLAESFFFGDSAFMIFRFKQEY